MENLSFFFIASKIFRCTNQFACHFVNCVKYTCFCHLASLQEIIFYINKLNDKKICRQVLTNREIITNGKRNVIIFFRSKRIIYIFVKKLF